MGKIKQGQQKSKITMIFFFNLGIHLHFLFIKINEVTSKKMPHALLELSSIRVLSKFLAPFSEALELRVTIRIVYIFIKTGGF